MSKYRVGEKSKNDNRVDSFIWHLGVPTRKNYIILGIFYHCQKLLTIFLKFQTKFDKDAVRDIIRYAIKENVGTSQQYDAKLITTWSNELMEACLVALTKLQKPFKYIGMILKYFFN